MKNYHYIFTIVLLVAPELTNYWWQLVKKCKANCFQTKKHKY